MKRDKPSLIERRDNLSHAISLLQRECEILNREIRDLELQSSTTLNSKFFYDSVVPLLSAAKNNGRTSKELQEDLKALGFNLNPAGFRTFLTRNKERGLLEMRQRSKGAALWFLTDKAFRNQRM